MPKKKKKKGKKPPKEEDEQPPEPEPVELSLEEEIKAFISAYIDSYMDYVEELNLDQEDFPLFYTYYPFDVTGYILPDDSTCVLFRGLAAATLIDIKGADFEIVDKEMANRKYDHICCYPESQKYTKEEAVKQARKDVELDVEKTRLLKQEDAERMARDHALKSMRLLTVVVPWAGARESEEGLPTRVQTQAGKFAPENLKIKEGEDFSTYSKRLKDLEKDLFTAKKEEAPPTEIPPPPEEAPAEKETPPPKEEPIKIEPSTPTTIPVPPGTTPANISIEIKQPEAMEKGEAFEEKRDLDILRLKKTLYIQTTDLEELKRKVMEMTNKLGNIEQMRQTVFRMNRKVYDTDARMTNVEKSTREMMRKVAEMSAEQREENKKMRRFIIERSKKARNQAMTVGGIALIIALVSLPLLVMLLMQFWDKIGPMLGF
jgi:hypothetical protein